MPKIPCSFHVSCPSQGAANLEFDPPLANFSSEAPDQEMFFEPHWVVTPFGPRPLFPDTDCCFYICESEFAYLAQICANNPPISGIGGGDGILPPVYGTNQSQEGVSYCPDGSPFKFTVPANTVFASNATMANRIAKSLASQYARQYKICLSDSQRSACQNTYIEMRISAAGGSDPITMTCAAVPAGMTFSTAGRTCIVSGTPTNAGNQSFTVRASDSQGYSNEKTYHVNVLGINSLPPDGVYGHDYDYTVQAEGGIAPYTYSIIGSLPPGLEFDAETGKISGKPSIVGSYGFRIMVSDDSEMESCGKDVVVTIEQTPITLTASPFLAAKYEMDPDPVFTPMIVSGALYFTDAITGTPSREPGETPGLYHTLQGSVAINPNYKITWSWSTLTIIFTPFKDIVWDTNVEVRPSTTATCARGDFSLTASNGTTIGGNPGAAATRHIHGTLDYHFTDKDHPCRLHFTWGGTNCGYLITIQVAGSNPIPPAMREGKTYCGTTEGWPVGTWDIDWTFFKNNSGTFYIDVYFYTMACGANYPDAIGNGTFTGKLIPNG